MVRCDACVEEGGRQDAKTTIVHNTYIMQVAIGQIENREKEEHCNHENQQQSLMTHGVGQDGLEMAASSVLSPLHVYGFFFLSFHFFLIYDGSPQMIDPLSFAVAMHVCTFLCMCVYILDLSLYIVHLDCSFTIMYVTVKFRQVDERWPFKRPLSFSLLFPLPPYILCVFVLYILCIHA